jgi:hypothetical protein
MAQIIIDGYNLMAKMDGMGGSLESRRERMIRVLSRYRTARGHDVTVVFDGERGEWPTESYDRSMGVDIVFSKIGEKADHVIKKMALQIAGEVVVITSDKEIASYVEHRGHVAIRSEDFLGRLRAPGGGSMESPGEEEEPGRPTTTKKRGNPRKLSKGARRRVQKLGKL